MSAKVESGERNNSLHQKRVETLYEDLLKINRLLHPPAWIDEVYIMKVGASETSESVTLASITENNREPDITHLFSLMAEVWTAGRGHGNIVSLDGQDGENFDFVVVVAFNGSDYYGFGNYLGGDFSTLSADLAWRQAAREFIKMITKVVTMME